MLVVVNVYRPDLGGGVLFADLCQGLCQRGWDVTVRCAYPYYPEWTDKSGQNGWKIRTEDDAGVRVERFGLYIPSNPNSFVQRLVYEASFFLSLARRPVHKGAFDAILVFSPLIGAVAYAGWGAKRTGTPLWLNVQDLSAQAAAAGGIVRHVSLLEKIQNALFRKADCWSSISPPMIQALASIPGAPEEIHFVPNWMHGSLGAHLRDAQCRSPIPASRPVRLLYSGNIGGKQNLLAFCQWLAESHHDFEFRIQGAGGKAEEVRRWIEAGNDGRFSMGDLTDEAGLAEKLAWADAYVITEKPGAGSSFVPSKLIPGMTSAAPILAVCDPDGPLGQEVSDHDVGFVALWNDPAALDSFFHILQHDPERYTTWTQQAAERGAFYDRERAMDRYVALLNHLIEQ